MTSKNINIPSDFPVLLKELSQAVLKQQPKDISLFCLNFFKDKINKRNNQENSNEEESGEGVAGI